jgi:hypothetical protein
MNSEKQFSYNNRLEWRKVPHFEKGGQGGFPEAAKGK